MAMCDDYKISDIIEVYQNAASVPTPSSSVIIPMEKNKVQIFTSWTIPDLVKSELSCFSRSFVVEHNSDRLDAYSLGIPNDFSNVCMYAFTSDGKKAAYVKEGKSNEGKSGENVYLEIWNSSKKLATYDMSDRKEHGKIHDSGVFKCLSWSSCGQYLLYIAEKKSPKTESYFKDLYVKNVPESNEKIVKGEKNLYKENWGETYDKVHHSVICIFNTQDGSIEVVDLEEKMQDGSVLDLVSKKAEFSDEWSAAWAIWGPNDESIVFVGYEEKPKRLGLAYCFNRRACLCSYNIKHKSIEILAGSDDYIWIGSPVFSPDFSFLTFLQSSAFGPHNSCKKIMKLNWATKHISIVIDIVNSVKGDDYAGIYSYLPARCWSSDGRYIFFSANRRSRLSIFCADVHHCRVEKFEFDNIHTSCTVLDVKDPYIVVSVSSPSITPFLMMGLISRENEKVKISWTSIDPDCRVELTDLIWKICPVTPTHINNSLDENFDAIVVKSTKKSNETMLVFLHGGPHSSFSASYYLQVVAFARLGFMVCLVNYRGSTGYGENSIKSLPGYIGTQDVSDVMAAIHMLQEDDPLRSQNLVLYGGSHGGYLACQIAGQSPKVFKGAVIRNPVFDLTSMLAVTDIPDWVWTESGYEYNRKNSVDPEVLHKMWTKSPLRYAKDLAETPCLIQLGRKDLRVPPSQGMYLYHILKEQLGDVSLYFYEDNHALSKTDVAADCFVHAALWFQKYVLL